MARADGSASDAGVGRGKAQLSADKNRQQSANSSYAHAQVLRSLAPPPLATIVLEGRNQTVYNRHQSCLPSVFAESATNCQVQQSTLVYRFIDA